MVRRSVLFLAGIMLLAAGAFAACFPAYDFSAAADSGAPDATSALDGTTGLDGAFADAPSSDAPATTDGGADALPDAPYIPYDGGPFDATATALIEGGTFAFQVYVNDTKLEDAQATLTYRFGIDRYEVTVGRFAGWVDAGMPHPAAGDPLEANPNSPYRARMTWQSSWDSAATSHSFDQPAGCLSLDPPGVATYVSNKPQAARFPITCVSWPQAVAFCAWEGKRLPTETEWRVVATGGGARGKEGDYPWASTPAPDPDCAHATYAGFPDGGPCGWPLVVGSAPLGASRDGVFDLVGSVSEWVWDFSDSSYPAGPQTNYIGMYDAGYPVNTFIDSDFTGTSPYFFTATQGANSGQSDVAYGHCGFRCASTL